MNLGCCIYLCSDPGGQLGLVLGLVGPETQFHACVSMGVQGAAM